MFVAVDSDLGATTTRRPHVLVGGVKLAPFIPLPLLGLRASSGYSAIGVAYAKGRLKPSVQEFVDLVQAQKQR